MEQKLIRKNEHKIRTGIFCFRKDLQEDQVLRCDRPRFPSDQTGGLLPALLLVQDSSNHRRDPVLEHLVVLQGLARQVRIVPLGQDGVDLVGLDGGGEEDVHQYVHRLADQIQVQDWNGIKSGLTKMEM